MNSAESEVDFGPSRRTSRSRCLTVYYSLPKNRFVNYVRAFMIVHLCSVVILFSIAAAKSGLDATVDFSGRFSELTIDVLLVLMALFLSVLFVHWQLEAVAVKLAEHPFSAKFRRRKKILHFADASLSFTALTYAIVKTVIVYDDDIKNDANYAVDTAWNNYLISMLAVVLFATFAHLVISVVLIWKLSAIYKMVQDPKNVHFYNQKGIEVDENGQSLLLSRRPKFRSKLTRVAALAYPEWKLLTLGTVCLLAASSSSLLLPYFFGEIIDDALNPHNDNLNKSIMILTIIAITGSLFALVRGWAFNLAGYNLVSRMRQDLFEAIIRQDIGFFDSSRVGELTSRLSSDTSVIQTSITTNVSMVLRYSIQIVASVAVMLWLSAPLSGVLLSVVPLVAVGAAQYGRFYARKVKHFQDALGVANTTAEECMSNVRTIRSFACDDKACEKYNADIDNSLKIGRMLSFIYGSFQGAVSLLVQCALVLVLWYGGKLVLDNSKDPSKGITIGNLSSFMMYSLNVAMAFAFLSSVFGDLMKAAGASTRLFQLIDRQPAISEPVGGLRMDVANDGAEGEVQFEAKVQFDQVTFAYPIRPDKNVLNNISFTVEEGQTVALVGPSGGGKSTCINLLLHFYEPATGTIKFGGVEMKDLDWEWYHEMVAVVSQEPVLFGYTVKENIAFGTRNPASLEQVMDAAKLANAHEFICNLEHGYDTLVGERGVRLSGGQKQRIAIARALIMNPRVLLLDEATSALDAESEAIVKDAIDRAMRNRTVLVIAHRLSTVKHADQVIVIENGKICEMGTHEELVEMDGVYKKLVVNQLMSGGSNRATSETEQDGQQTSSVSIQRDESRISDKEIVEGNSSSQSIVTQAEVNDIRVHDSPDGDDSVKDVEENDDADLSVEVVNDENRRLLKDKDGDNNGVEKGSESANYASKSGQRSHNTSNI